MLSKTVVFLCILYFVGANVIVNIFDDDVDTVRSSVRSCNLRWCEQKCRNMGFPGGVCVEDRCKCDINKIRDTVHPPVRMCVMQWCDKQCRDMGFSGGVCYGDICKCDMNKIKDELENEIPVEYEVKKSP